MDFGAGGEKNRKAHDPEDRVDSHDQEEHTNPVEVRSAFLEVRTEEILVVLEVQSADSLSNSEAIAVGISLDFQAGPGKGSTAETLAHWVGDIQHRLSWKLDRTVAL